MKLLLRLLLLVMIGSAYAQSNLPACEGVDPAKWNNCFGSFTHSNGLKYVGEHRNSMRHGLGVLYAADGSVINQGIWVEDRFIRSAQTYQVSSPNLSKKYSNQTNLPECQGNDIYRWSNCFGIEYYLSGRKYVGAWNNGERNGQGTLYAPDGSVINEGVWANNAFIRSESTPQANTPIIEGAKLRAQAEEAKRKQAEQEQLRLSQNQPLAPPVISTPTPATTSSMGKRLALVIGNQAYNVRPLLNPRNDADDMSRALKNAGFEVIDVRDASLAQMRNAVRQFGDRLLTRDVGLVYYSGHGIEVRGRNYFIPVNADIKRSDEIADQSLDVNLILEKMETAKKGVNILIVDACRDDPFGRSFRSSSRGLANMDAPQGTIIAFATSPGKVAADGEGRNSPYTKNLIKTMQIPNLPIEQVFKQVRRAVQQETKNQQTPWENTSLSGDFYFSVKK